MRECAILGSYDLSQSSVENPLPCRLPSSRERRDSRLFIDPEIDQLHKYSVKSYLPFKVVRPRIKWIGEVRDDFSDMLHMLESIPQFISGNAKFMEKTEGCFVVLELRDNLRLTISQYVDDWDCGAYVNFILDGKVVSSEILSIPNIVESINMFYKGI